MKHPPAPLRRAPWRLLEVSGPVLRGIEGPPGPVPPFAWDACPFAEGWACAVWDGAGLLALETGFAEKRSAAAAAMAALRAAGCDCTALFSANPGAAEKTLRDAFAGKPLRLHGPFTDFQLAVFRALAAIPCGQTVTYGALAELLGRPGAQRAVARALASNRYAFALPCHRVVPATGGAGGWRWGTPLKERVLASEAGGAMEGLLAHSQDRPCFAG